MSANLVRGFFPSVAGFLETHPLLVQLWRFAFPPAVEELCPRPQLSLQVWREASVMIHWPLASVLCVVGIGVGMSHCVPLLMEASRGKQGSREGCFTWGMAFLWYALMSLGGLMFHCILPSSTFFYLLDVASTASCCIAIVLGTGSSIAKTRPRLLQPRPQTWIRAPTIDDTSFSGKVSLCAMAGFAFALASSGAQYIRDLLYLVPALLAFASSLRFYAAVIRMSPRPSPRSLLSLHCSALSSAMAVSAIVFDSWLCRNLGPEFGVLPWFFLGSDIALPCLYHSIKRLETAHAKRS